MARGVGPQIGLTIYFVPPTIYHSYLVGPLSCVLSSAVRCRTTEYYSVPAVTYTTNYLFIESYTPWFVLVCGNQWVGGCGTVGACNRGAATTIDSDGVRTKDALENVPELLMAGAVQTVLFARPIRCIVCCWSFINWVIIVQYYTMHRGPTYDSVSIRTEMRGRTIK